MVQWRVFGEDFFPKILKLEHCFRGTHPSPRTESIFLYNQFSSMLFLYVYREDKNARIRVIDGYVWKKL